MGRVRLLFYCPACGREWPENAWGPEHWEGWKRMCPYDDCAHVGLRVTEVPNGWTPPVQDGDG